MMKKKKGFTLAEVLITLTIIGIVAAISLPTLLVNVNEKAWDSQRKALHARLAQALAMLPRLNGYGTYDEETDTDTVAEAFISEGLATVYKITTACTTLSSCGLPDTITTLNSSSEIDFPQSLGELRTDGLMLQYANGTTAEGETAYTSTNIADTAAAAFETQNGESIAVYYNPDCGSDSSANHYAQSKMCVNFIYDLNGSQGPNQVGKDIGFITALYRTNPVVVAPMPFTSNAASATFDNAAASCKAQDSDARLPDRDELAAMMYNGSLIGITSGYFWSGSVISAGSDGLAWGQVFAIGHRRRYSRSYSLNVRCVRR